MSSMPENDVSVLLSSNDGRENDGRDPPPMLLIPPNDVSASAHARDLETSGLTLYGVDGIEKMLQPGTMYRIVGHVDSRPSTLSIPSVDLLAGELA
jgi:hypothetical protein